MWLRYSERPGMGGGTGDFSEKVLAENRERLGATIQGLEQERAELSVQIDSQALTDEQISTVVDFAEEVGLGLVRAEEDFDARRRIIELLDVRATLAVENDEDRLCALHDRRGCSANCDYEYWYTFRYSMVPMVSRQGSPFHAR